MIFPKRQDYYGPFTSQQLGQIAQLPNGITREFLVESIIVVVRASNANAGGAAGTTANPDGIANLLKRVTLQVTDGARSRNVVDCSGPALLELQSRWRGIDATTQASLGLAVTAQNTWTLAYRIDFRHPRIADPEGSFTLLPVNRYSSNPQLTLYWATQADIDQANAPTFAVDTAGFTYYVIVNRRQVSASNWPIYDTELIEQVQSYPSSGANQLFELPVPGAYTHILIRGYSGAAPTIVRAIPMLANGDVKIQVLGTVLRRFQPAFEFCEDTANPPLWSGVAAPPPTAVPGASVYVDFLHPERSPSLGDYGSVLDVNPLIKTGARAQILADVNGGAGVQLKYMWHRIYGDLSALKAATKMQ